MPIRRTIIIPAILALSAAASILTGSAVSAAAAQAPSVHVVAAARQHSLYHGTSYLAHDEWPVADSANRGRPVV